MFWFVCILLGLLIGFAIMFRLVKSGRLTIYMVAIDAALIKAEPILETVAEFDFDQILTVAQHGWVVLVATVLAGVARVRRQILDGMGVS